MSSRRVSDLPLDTATLRRLSVAADVDPRTIAKIFRGGHPRGMSGQRARRVLIAHGYLPAESVTATTEEAVAS